MILERSIKAVLLCSIFVAVLFFDASAQEIMEAQIVRTEGLGAIVNNDTAMARDSAIEDALRKAVEQTVGTQVDSETIVQNFQLLSDQIYTRTKGYIQNYRIISEVPMDNLYKVIIEATVSLGSLKDDLAAIGLLMIRKHKPRVMFMVAEQNIGQEYMRHWWGHRTSETDLSIVETVLVEEFRGKGFHVVDHAAKATNITINKAYQVVDLTDNTAISLGNQYDAEVVIVGKALTKRVGRVMNTSMKSCQANITARAIRTDNGAIIASTTAHGAAVHIDDVTGGTEALKKAGVELATKIMDQIIDTWSREVGGTTLVEMTINGISSYKDFVKLKNVLQQQIRGVKGVYQRSIGAGVAKVEIDIKGDAQSLADELATKDFQDFSIDVTVLTQNFVELTIQPKNP